MEQPTKPNWDTAPDWANFLAMNEYGFWCWFQSKPDDGYVGHWNTQDHFEVAVHGVNHEFPYWRDTLESKPNIMNKETSVLKSKIKYRVLLQEDFKNQKLTYAIFVNADGLFGAEKEALSEFPEAIVINIRQVQ